jgi:hypothetical protein
VNEYTRRQYSDGSFDSICMTCYRTVGRAPNEDALTVLEKEHKCDVESIFIRNKRRA